MFVHAPSPSKVQPWNGHSSSSPRDLAADAEVRAEVRAEGVLEVEVAGLVAPEHEVGAPVPQRGDLPGGEVVRDTRPGTSRTGAGTGSDGHGRSSYGMRTDSNSAAGQRS